MVATESNVVQMNRGIAIRGNATIIRRNCACSRSCGQFFIIFVWKGRIWEGGNTWKFGVFLEKYGNLGGCSNNCWMRGLGVATESNVVQMNRWIKIMGNAMIIRRNCAFSHPSCGILTSFGGGGVGAALLIRGSGCVG